MLRSGPSPRCLCGPCAPGLPLLARGLAGTGRECLSPLRWVNSVGFKASGHARLVFILKPLAPEEHACLPSYSLRAQVGPQHSWDISCPASPVSDCAHAGDVVPYQHSQVGFPPGAWQQELEQPAHAEAQCSQPSLFPIPAGTLSASSPAPGASVLCSRFPWPINIPHPQGPDQLGVPFANCVFKYQPVAQFNSPCLKCQP